MDVSCDTPGLHDVLCSNSILTFDYQSIILQVRDKKALVKTFQQNTVLLQLVAASLRCLQCNSKNWLK